MLAGQEKNGQTRVYTNASGSAGVCGPPPVSRTRQKELGDLLPEDGDEFEPKRSVVSVWLTWGWSGTEVS
jgi:hypothetical protein